MSADGTIDAARERPLSRLGKAALKYAEFGWRVFPCEPQGKTPLDLCDGCYARLPAWDDGVKVCRACGCVHEKAAKLRGFHLGTTDAALVEAWWRHAPDANIGIATGQGILVLDIDGPEGEASLAALVAQHGALPPTPVQKTGKGRHFLFAITHDLPNSASRVGEKIDTRGDGGYVVVAPSVHPNGQRYEWSVDALPSKVRPAPLPDWIVEALTAKPEPAPAPSTPPPAPVSGLDRYVQTAMDREFQSVAACPPGRRNDTLNRAAYNLGTLVGAGQVSETQARSHLETAAVACGLKKSEYAATIASGLAAGIANPRAMPEPRARAASGGARASRPIRVATSEGEHVEPEAATTLHTRGSVWAKGEPPDFLTNAEGMKLKSSLHNILLHLRGETQLVGLFALDELSRHVMVTRAPPWPGPDTPRLYSDADITALCAYLEQHALTPKFDSVKRAIGLVSRENMINPVRERLESFEWDGIARLDHWTVDFLGATDTSFSRQAGARWLISACARILRPGCKVDTMLVLEGPQGARKSSALAAIASALGEHCFTDRLSKLDGKDAVIELQGNIIVEIAELDAFRGSQVSTIKAFLSRQTDKIRLPWDATITELPRACVFAGTVNPGGAGWLHDATGARRFWPLAVGRIDIDGLKQAAPQLWAEALDRYNHGEEWWITDALVLAEAERAADERYDDDPWAAYIDDYIVGKNIVFVHTVLSDALSMPKDRQDKTARNRVGAHLHRCGFKHQSIRSGGRVVMGFKRTTPETWADDGADG